jgi:oxygen-independent coproporphyrinogen-3 oxidase
MTRPVENRLPDGHQIGLYVHIPFCETKCPYCDFNTYSGIERLIPVYVDALCEELRRWASLFPGHGARTVFFGGGTPSYLPSKDLEQVMSTLTVGFPLARGAEVTLEANPGDVTQERAAVWLEAGFTRVSMGVQSFDDGLLALLGRRHTAAQAVEAFSVLRAVGFENRSLDLIFGLPQQTMQQWQESLDQTLELGPSHVSLYGLQIEEGTPLEAFVRTGKIPLPDDDLAADMYLAAREKLAAAGFRHYEISNWALPGMESRHNLIYWRNEPYLGVGPGAHSSMLGHRFANIKSPRWYVRSLGFEVPADGLLNLAGSQPRRPDIPESTSGQIRRMASGGPVDFVEETTPNLELAETMMMGMRLDTGVRESDFRARFGKSLRDVFSSEIDQMLQAGLIEEDAVGIKLSNNGKLLGNEVFGVFVAAAEALAPAE